MHEGSQGQSLPHTAARDWQLRSGQAGVEEEGLQQFRHLPPVLGSEPGELAKISGRLFTRVECVAHKFVVGGKDPVPYLQFTEGKLRFELKGVGQAVTEGHVDAPEAPVAAEHV